MTRVFLNTSVFLLLETDEIESLVLEDDLPQISRPPAEVVNAWGEKAVQPG